MSLHKTDYKKGVDFIRQQTSIQKNINQMIKWFDDLSWSEKQNLTTNFYGRKGVKISNCNKIILYNQIHVKQS